MKFQAKAEEELGKRVVLDPGEYPFEVIEAIETFSKKGNEMIQLKVKVNGVVTLRDYLLDAMDFKVKHFCEATGLHRLYKSGELRDFDCRGKTGRLEVGIETGQDRNGEAYDRNHIIDYCALDELEFPAPAPAPTPTQHNIVAFDEDDIPF